MDRFSAGTRAGLSFAEWKNLGPEGAAREVHARLDALPAPLRRAAVAWTRPVDELAASLRDAPAGPLHGVPCALKDLFDLAGVPTRAGSGFLAEVRAVPERDCRLVARLRELGAAVAAKTHLMEFASGLTGENIHYGDCPHPHAPDRLPGGSSSGSAALVGAGVVPFAIGTDTGGSVRVPGSWCGTYGFRLVPGEEFIRDCFPLSATCDTAGWFTARPDDMLLAWRAITGGGAAPNAMPRGCFLGMADLISGADPATAVACDAAAAAICPPADATTRAALLDGWREARMAYSTISMREAHAVHQKWMQPYKDRYDPVIWGRYAEAGGWPAERLAAAQAAKSVVRQAWDRYFEAYDFLVMPAVPTPPPRKADCTMELRLNILTLTAPASVGGRACLSLPVPLESGLTAGLQVVLRDPTSAVVPWLLDGRSVG